MIKFHHNDQIIKERQKERDKNTEELKKKNEQKQKRKDMIKEAYLQKLDSRRKELSDKLKMEQEKEDAYNKQKEVIIEQKYTNQMIDQMKVHYYKEIYYNMKVNNQTGTEEFDKMTKQLISIPVEDCARQTNAPDKLKIRKRISSAFGFAMNQFRNNKTIKPVRSAQALSITARVKDAVRTRSKKNKTRGGSNSSIHKAYSTGTTNINIQKAIQSKNTQKVKAAEDIEKAKNIFITGGEDQEQDDNAPSPSGGLQNYKEENGEKSHGNDKTDEVDKIENNKT
jgi:hypothetical protein